MTNKIKPTTALSHVEEVGKTILNHFKKMPRSLQKEFASEILYEPRSLKYMRAYTCLPLPLQAYVWGFMSYAEATSLIDTKLTIECDDFDDYTQNSNKISDTDTYIYNSVLENFPAEAFQSDIRTLLNEMNVEPAVIDKIAMSYPQFFVRLLSDEKYNNDSYVDLLRRFGKGYVPVLEKLSYAMRLYVDRALSLNDTNECFLENNKPLNRKGIDELIDQLSLTNDLLNWDCVSEKETKSKLKLVYYWKHTVQALISGLIKEMVQMAPHNVYPDISAKVCETGAVFSGFFPKELDKKLKIYQDLLLVYARETLKDVAQNEVQATDLLEKFDLATNKKGTKMPKSAAHRKEEDKADEVTQDALNLTQLIREVFVSAMQSQKTNIETVPDVSELELVIDEFHQLKCKYLSETERNDTNKLKALYSYMNDSELLYTIGVLNCEEYTMCQGFQMNKDPETGEIVFWEQSIQDIYMELIESEDKKPLLPLTKDCVDAMEQVRMASRLYYDLYVDTGETRIDLAQGSIFENDYDAAPTMLRKEGLFLEDMILLNQHIGGHLTRKLLEKTVDSYWNESLRLLIEMKLPENRPEIRSHIQDNLIFFNTDTSTLQKFKDSFKKRKALYPYLLSLIKYDVLKHTENDYANRNRIFEKVKEGIKPFEQNLRITKATHEKVFLMIQKDIQNGRLN